MQEVIRVAVCDDIKEDRNALIKILSDYLDKNNFYVEIDEFPSGEAFPHQIQRDISLFSWIYSWTN